MENRPPTEATANTSTSAPVAPAKDMAGSARAKAACAPVAMAITAPSAPPVDTPMMPGSAIGLRNSPCITAPATPRAAPTVRARAMRGSRMDATIACSVSGAAACPIPICASSMSAVWEKGMV